MGTIKENLLTFLLAAMAIGGALFLALGNGSKDDAQYPHPLRTWANNTNVRIYGADCQASEGATLCDVHTTDGMHKVRCTPNACSLVHAQEHRQE